MRALLSTVLAAAAAVVLSLPVSAGGWATTLLDPLPGSIEAGHGYTIGFWILQHGSHPAQAGLELRNPGLRMVAADGRTVTFSGVALHEAGHYATVLMLPEAGAWTVFGMQAPFADYRVGVLNLPGGITVEPTPQPLAFPGDPTWSTVKPPSVSAQGVVPAAAAVPPPQTPASQPPASPRTRTQAESPSWPPAGLVLLLVIAAAGLGAAAGYLGRSLRAAPLSMPTPD